MNYQVTQSTKVWRWSHPTAEWANE